MARVLPFLLAVALLTGSAFAAEPRFPQPEFQSGYVQPRTPMPLPRPFIMELLDLAVLAAVLLLAARLALVDRSRRGILLLTVFSLLYFGFHRKGCICPVGSTQNMVLALSDGSYPLPLAAAGFFLLPLIAALFFGRTFCAAVCPLGAVQDLVVVRPLRVPSFVAQALGTLPYLSLAAVALLAGSGAGFMICRYDPFVPLFRIAGSTPLIAAGGVLLAAGIFIARPYCRFLCPYGVLLKWMSRFSRRHATITPDRCLQCRLCEDACPFGAIEKPALPGEQDRRGRRALALALLCLPLLAAGGGWLGAGMKGMLSLTHPTVRLADRMVLEEGGRAAGTTLASDAFRQSDRPLPDLLQEADALRGRFRTGGMAAGIILGLALGGKFIVLSRRRRNRDYEPDRAACFSCGRCFASCPVEYVRLGGSEADYSRLQEILKIRGGENSVREAMKKGTLLEVLHGQEGGRGA